MDRDEEIAGLNLAFVALGFDLRNAQTDQPAGDAARSRTDGSPAQRGDDRPRGDEGSDSRNGQCADSGDPAQRPADDATRAGASDSPFRGFRVLLVSEIAGCALVREQHGDVVVGEVRGFELIDNSIGLPTGGGDAEYRFL